MRFFRKKCLICKKKQGKKDRFAELRYKHIGGESVAYLCDEHAHLVEGVSIDVEDQSI